MSIFEAYLFLLTDTIFGNIILYPSYEFISFVMKDLGIYNSISIFLTASTGFCFAIIINYFCGRVLLRIYLASVEESKQHNYNRFCHLFKKYGRFILLLHLVPPFGNIIPLLSGFTRFSFFKTWIIMLATKMVYYTYFILL
jgi:membrane protein YqaA with SNARE-associated domain